MVELYDTNIRFCPECMEVYDAEEFEFLGLVVELGNIARFRHRKCGSVFEELPPDIMPQAIADNVAEAGE